MYGAFSSVTLRHMRADNSSQCQLILSLLGSIEQNLCCPSCAVQSMTESFLAQEEATTSMSKLRGSSSSNHI